MKKYLNHAKSLGRLICTIGLLIATWNSALAQAPAPAPLLITGATANTIGLAWNDIYDNEDGFRLSRWDGMNYTTVAVLGPNVTNYLDTGLSVGATYYYDVVAFNVEGDSYPAANSAQTTPVPSPSPLTITSVTGNTIGLAWNDIYNNEDGFRLNRWDGMTYTTIAVLGPNVTNYLDIGLSVGVTYYYDVVAFNSGGDSYPAANFAQTTPIAAPAPLVITGVTGNTIDLAWNDLYDNEDGFRLNRWDGMNYTTIAVLGPNVTNYLDIGLSVGVTYYYDVVAFNSGGDSYPAANSAQTTPIPAPSPLVITGVTGNTIGLAWNDIYNNEDGFRLNRWDGMNYTTIAVLGPNVTNYLDIGLSVGVTYYYDVVAFNSGGDSYPAANSAQTTPIPAPAPLEITGVTGTTIALAWNDIYNNEDGFRLNRWDGMNYVTIAVLAPNVTNYLDIGLSVGVTYYYDIVAFNSGGDSYPAANSAQTQPISAPEPLVITGITANTIGLAWNDIYNNEDGFRVNRYDGMNYTTVAVLGPNVTNYLDIGLSVGVTYNYDVVAFNSGGESYPAVNSAQTKPIPAPDPLVITGATANTIALAWNDIYDNEDGFRLERSTDSMNFTLIATLAANVTNYLDTGLMPENFYFYRVVAFNSSGDSFYSATVSGGATPVPAPDPLVVTTVGSTQVALSWNDIYDNEDGFRLERSTDSVNFSTIATLPAGTTNYASTNLLPSTFYSYRVAAFNSGGDSHYSMTVNATTLPLPPFTPSGLAASALSQTAIALTWTDTANNETGFNIERSVDGINFTQSSSVVSNISNYADSGLTPATAYYYRVAATNAGGRSAYSAVASVTTLPNPPAAPSALVATAVSSNRVQLTWTDNANNETGYLVEGSINGTTFVQLAALGPNVTTYTNSGLAPSTTYYYRVRATNSGGNSAYSNVATATTGAVAPPAAPTGLTLSVVSSSQINLTWTDNSNNETQFLIERSQNGNSFTQIATVSANVSNYSATGLQANTRYYFRVRASNSAGNSAYSNTANAKTLH